MEPKRLTRGDFEACVPDGFRGHSQPAPKSRQKGLQLCIRQRSGLVLRAQSLEYLRKKSSGAQGITPDLAQALKRNQALVALPRRQNCTCRIHLRSYVWGRKRGIELAKAAPTARVAQAHDPQKVQI